MTFRKLFEIIDAYGLSELEIGSGARGDQSMCYITDTWFSIAKIYDNYSENLYINYRTGEIEVETIHCED